MSETRLNEILEIMRIRELLAKREKDTISRFTREILIDEKLKETIELICTAVREQFGANYEWIGYLLGNDDYVVKHIFIPYQRISRAFVREDPEKAGNNLIDLERVMNKTGYKLVGWIHSHGDMSPFHSSTDDRNTYALVRFIGYHSKKSVLKPDSTPKRVNKFSCKGRELVVTGEKTVIKIKLNLPIELIRVLINNTFLERGNEVESFARILALILNYSDWWFFERKWIAPVYSVVTNADLDFYGEIWVYDSEKDPKRVKKGGIVRFIKSSDKEIQVTRYHEIREVVKEKMTREYFH